ncbi:DUF475 domain-containing protein [Blattabacterium cuenoti]|uniref:DUF475 domain-containing protein n=1 Tax=Blattabacterium cuenoti TaxID=1653831 RepID=UPI001EEAAD59|nr:DUF475 domain-containing protein [Blattabacterium cuenoti]
MEFIKDIINNPLLSISTIGNLIIIESILSIDNAIILSSMILNLKNEKDRKNAIKYGILGAYFFRILCLIFISFLIKIQWIKLIGGIYLIIIGINHFFINKNKKKIKNNHINKHSNFWKTIIIIEIIDLSFSIDNIFASIALSKNIFLILLGSFIGIISIRLSTKFFIKLIKKYHSLNHSIFIIIILLGIKLFLSFFYEKNFIKKLLSNHYYEYVFTLMILIIFIIPFFFKKSKLQ